jgi:ligand-binding SRPBCC domain-containing protein
VRLHRLEARQVIPVPREEAWAFFSDPANLAVMTPPDLGLVPTCDVPPRMHPGLIVTYAVAGLPGLKFNWVTEITHVDEGSIFVDEQRSGPYRFWHHQHHFADAPGGTEVRDLVHYALPFGLLGDTFGYPIVRKRLHGIFAFRRKVLAERFGTTKA